MWVLSAVNIETDVICYIQERLYRHLFYIIVYWHPLTGLFYDRQIAMCVLFLCYIRLLNFL